MCFDNKCDYGDIMMFDLQIKKHVCPGYHYAIVCINEIGDYLFKFVTNETDPMPLFFPCL